MAEVHTDVCIVGGGLGGVAAALSILDRGLRVVLTESTPWLGGQLTSQGVPPDEHPWIEEIGATRGYRRLRTGIRDYYRRHYPLTASARKWKHLNPGAGTVSKLCHEPRVGVAVIDTLVGPWRASGRLSVLQPAVLLSAETDGDDVLAVTVDVDGSKTVITAEYFIDATEAGDLLPLAGVDYRVGSEAQGETGEPSAAPVAAPDNLQAFSYCFAMDHVDGNHVIDRPQDYGHWRSVQPSFWGAPQLSWCSPDPRTLEPVERQFAPNPNSDPKGLVADQSQGPGDQDLWLFRRIAARRLFRDGVFDSDITLVNWAAIDYFEAPLIDVQSADANARLEAAKQLSLSMLYWMQTEAPRPDGGTGFPGLRLRHDVFGTHDGLAHAPYIREGRRICARMTVSELDVSQAVRGDRGIRHHHDSVGIGMYRIDLHPSTGGDNYLDVAAVPFEIPLGTLIPQRVRNLLPGSKNIGTTHIANGCYRTHPVEWNIGEVSGQLVATCVKEGRRPEEISTKDELLERFQDLLAAAGVELRWPPGHAGY